MNREEYLYVLTDVATAMKLDINDAEPQEFISDIIEGMDIPTDIILTDKSYQILEDN